MEQLRIPEGYHSPLTIRETEVAIISERSF